MEGRKRADHVYDDEFELLLGQIPNATSQNGHVDDPFNVDISLRLGTIPAEMKSNCSPSNKFANLYSSPRSVRSGGDVGYIHSPAFSGSPIRQNLPSNGSETHAFSGQQDGLNLPDERSLSFAFEGLSFRDRVTSKPTSLSVFEHNHNSPQNNFMNTSEMYVPHSYQPMHENVKIPEYFGIDLKKKKAEILPSNLTDQRQDFPGYNGTVSLNPRMHPYQLLPNVPSPYQQPLFLDPDVSALVQHRHLGQSNMAWQKMEEERIYRLQQQYMLYQQQLQNQRSEVLNIQRNMNLASNPLSGSQVQQHCEFLSSPNSFRNGNAVHSASNQYHSQSSGRRVSDEDMNHYFPERSLTRSHRVNPLRSNRSNSVRNNPSSLFSTSKGQHLAANNGSLGSYPQNSRSTSPDSSDFLHASIDEVRGKIYTLAKDQQGCRSLQEIITEGNQEDITEIFNEIICHIAVLMTDPFGNYLVQKLLEVCNEEQRMQIVRVITVESNRLLIIACDMHGTRAVQKVIETLKAPEQIYMVASSLKPGIVPLMKDVNGNHVAQRCLQNFTAQQSEFLFNAAIAHCVDIGTDRQGCCVLQKCVYHAYGDQRNRLLSEICSHSLILSQDLYGNYVVQFVLDQKVPWVITNVVNQLEGNYIYLSRQKYSSNVVERCLKLAKEEDCIKIVQELMASSQFLDILQDPFGNYVIQSALKLSKGSLNAALVEAIKPHVAVLRSNPFGKKILACASLKK